MTLLKPSAARPVPRLNPGNAVHTSPGQRTRPRPIAQVGLAALTVLASGAVTAAAQTPEPKSTCYVIVAGSYSGSVQTQGKIPCDCDYSSGVGVNQGDGTLVVGSRSSNAGSYCDGVVTAYPPYQELQPGGQLSTTVTQSQSATIQLGSCFLTKNSGFLGLFAGCRAACQYTSFHQPGFNLYAYGGSCQGDPLPPEASVPFTFGASPW